MYAPQSSNSSSYNNERPPSAGEAEVATDPASGGFFHSDYKKHEDLKQMLDSNKDNLKLEAMKRIIGMVAKGRDASELFPAVVKNVVSKNIEVKKLVYVYLVRYAEEQQDLALLSISTFQRALKDPNQLIRASALRVLSSIRVTMIVPIVMLAIKDAAADMSPYVRKTAAHAIPKLYSLDQEQKEELIQVLEKLLSDKTTLVVGSAVMAFEEVCPQRADLIHRNFCKLCSLLVDVDEWGQVVIINMLTRYARSQFADPNLNDTGENERPFYEDDSYDDDEEDSNARKRASSLDPDHRLLLRSAKPLLQSRNASVVLAVAQLYHYIAPRAEVSIVAKALVRLLRSHREVQDIVLTCVAAMAASRKGMFEPFLKSFFVRSSDATHVKLLKLEILTSLATETNIGIILRELQTYVQTAHDPLFVAAAIQAIGRCASNIKEVTDTCLNGLVSLLSNKEQAVVAESVVVIKKLLQTQPSAHREILVQMARLMDSVSVPQARASILWLLGEYSERVPKIAPDVLRKVAKTFVNEEDIVKLQAMTLAVKLYLTNPKQTTLLAQYVLTLARYDQNYDLRDRARFLRHFVFPGSDGEKAAKTSRLSKHARKFFLATKPAPQSDSFFSEREQFQLGSLSHYVNARAPGYQEIPPFPEIPPDPSVRNTVPALPWPEKKGKKPTTVKKRSFYSSSESGDEDSSAEEDEEEVEEDEESSGSEEGEESDTEEEEEEGSSGDGKPGQRTIRNASKATGEPAHNSDDDDEEDDDDESDSDSESASESGSESDTEDESEKEETKPKSKPVPKAAAVTKAPAPRNNLDLLLGLDDVPPTFTPVMTPSLGGFLTPLTPVSTLSTKPGVQLESAKMTSYESFELLSKLNSGGLSVRMRFTRSPHLFSSHMTSLELTFTNHGDEPIKNIRLGNKTLGKGVSVHDFAPISTLTPNISTVGILGVDFADSTQPVTLELLTGETGTHKLVLKAPIGEIVRAVSMPEVLFISEQGNLRGMNENTTTLNLSSKYQDLKSISLRILQSANLCPVPSSEPSVLRFAGQTLSSQSMVLVSVTQNSPPISTAQLIVNCEKMVVGSMLLTQLKAALSA